MWVRKIIKQIEAELDILDYELLDAELENAEDIEHLKGQIKSFKQVLKWLKERDKWKRFPFFYDNPKKLFRLNGKI